MEYHSQDVKNKETTSFHLAWVSSNGSIVGTIG
jgi:hypothetical protein